MTTFAPAWERDCAGLELLHTRQYWYYRVPRKYDSPSNQCEYSQCIYSIWYWECIQTLKRELFAYPTKVSIFCLTPKYSLTTHIRLEPLSRCPVWIIWTCLQHAAGCWMKTLSKMYCTNQEPFIPFGHDFHPGASTKLDMTRHDMIWVGNSIMLTRHEILSHVCILNSYLG